MSGHRKKSHVEGTKPELPITPMLDMSFQLMAFFILTFRPTPTEAMLPLALPKQEGGPPSAPPPSLDNPVEEEELIVQVYATDNGNVSRIIAALKTGDVELGSRTEDLIKFLKEHKAASGGKSAKIKLECVEGLNYQYVIQMMDTARRVGYDQISPTLLGGGRR